MIGFYQMYIVISLVDSAILPHPEKPCKRTGAVYLK